MARKSGNRHHRAPKLGIAKGHHFMYSTAEDGSDATVVRYLGEQDGDRLLCYLPQGIALWLHVHYLWNTPKRMLEAA